MAITADEFRARLKAGDKQYLKLQNRVLKYLQDYPKTIFFPADIAQELNVDLVKVCVITQELAKQQRIISVAAYTSRGN